MAFYSCICIYISGDRIVDIKRTINHPHINGSCNRSVNRGKSKTERDS